MKSLHPKPFNFLALLKNIAKEFIVPLGTVVGAFAFYWITKASMTGGMQANIRSITGGTTVLNGTGITDPLRPTGTANTDSLLELISAFTNWALPYFVIIAVVMIIYAGFLMVTAAGDENKISQGKTIIVWTVIAIFIVIASYAIVNTVINFSS